MQRDPASRAAEVEAVTDATRALARSVDPAAARVAVCEGAREVAAAPVAALFEPGPGDSGLIPQAWVGAELAGLELPLNGESGATLAFTRAEEVFVALGDGEAEADSEFLRRAKARAVLWHPVVRERAAIGVLAIAWREEVAGVSLRLSAMIDLLGAEAAVAIGRADLLGQLEHLARTDSLTGLPNRRHWEQQLPRELSRASRVADKVCVAMLDLDHFKDYNDRRGHQAGDRLLAAGAISWRSALRPYDILARYGGEEFAVILPGCELVDALTLVERLRSVTPEGESCSAGIAEWDGEEQPEALVGRADAALYRAKRGGRDQSILANDNIHT
jgi:diguanylate cyclase (GGDEF)-like protein